MPTITRWILRLLVLLLVTFFLAPYGLAQRRGKITPKGRTPAKEKAADEEGLPPLEDEDAEAEGEEEEEEAAEEERLDAAIELEIRYAEALTHFGMPDYAKKVIDGLNADAVGPRLKVLQLQGLIAMGKFDEVMAKIRAEPDQNGAAAWAMKLALADGYFAWGKYPEARGIYDVFFKRYKDGPPKELNKFYRDSAYKYAQMLILMGDRKAAIQAYRYGLKAKLKKHVKRQFMTETAELLVAEAEHASPTERKTMFAEIEKLVETVLYQGANDLWFGKAMTIMAHQKVIEGDIDGAQFLVETFWEQVVALDGALRYEEQKEGINLTRYSPLAEVRFLLGSMLLKEAQKLDPTKEEDKLKIFKLLADSKDDRGKRRDGAYRHFMTIFYEYPSSNWAPDALNRAKEAGAMLEKIGAKIKVNIPPEKMAEVVKAQFREANNLYKQQQFKQAAEIYFRALNMFPEEEVSVGSLGNLARCYIEMNLMANVSDEDRTDNDRIIEMLVNYLCERFSKNKELSVRAGDEVLRIATKFEETGKGEQRMAAYNHFFESFIDHPRTPDKLFEFGQAQFNASNWDGALNYFLRVATNYVDNRVYHPALSKVSQCYAKKEDYIQEAKTLLQLIESLKKETAPGQLLVSSMYRLAYAYEQVGVDYMKTGEDEEKKKLGERYVATAIKKFRELVDILSDPANPYQKTPEEADNNKKMIQGSLYYTAMSFSRLTRPADKVEAFKKLAVQNYEKLVAEHKDSPFSPSALAQIGTLYTIMKDPVKATQAFERLKKEYADSDEAKNVDFMLAMGLLQQDMRDEAIKVFKEMFRKAGTQYTETQIYAAGNELLKAGEYEIALEAFRKSSDSAKKGSSIHELSLLGRGKAAVETKNGEEAVKALEQMLADYPNSRTKIEGNMYLSRAYGLMGAKEPDAQKRFVDFNNARKCINVTRRLLKPNTPEWLSSDIAIARIYISNAKAEKQFGGGEAAVNEAYSKAIVPLWLIATTARTDNPALIPLIEEAYYMVIPLYLETKRWKDAYDRASEYLKQFATGGKYLSDIRRFRGQAETKMIMEGIKKDEPGAEPEAVPGEEPAAEPAAEPGAEPAAEDAAAAPAEEAQVKEEAKPEPATPPAEPAKEAAPKAAETKAQAQPSAKDEEKKPQ